MKAIRRKVRVFGISLKSVMALQMLSSASLFKFTELQTSYGINNVALSKGRPKILSIRSLIGEFVDFRMEVVIRRASFELRKAKERAHILNGYLIALDHLDKLIHLIRKFSHTQCSKDNLINAGWGLDEIQAKAILELRLQRLTGMELDKIKEEYDELQKQIAGLEELLANEALRYDLIREN